jgi:hypothetical protein
MPKYKQASREDVDLLDEVMREYHPKLVEAEVRVGLLYANAPRDKRTGEPKGPALKHNGYPALAVVKINSLKDRVEGKPDATITLDGDRWGDCSQDKKVATLDHECEHLALVEDKDGNLKIDDANRPELTMRIHDIVVGGFLSVIERHKQNACESEQFVEANRIFHQVCFPWG